MKKYKCKECNFEAEGSYWNETLEGQVMGSDEYVPIEEEHEGLIWKCPACDKDVKVEEV